MAAPVESPHGEVRFGAALRWLLAQPAESPLLVLGPTLDAANDLLRAAALQQGALFGWALESAASLAARLSALPLAEQRLTLAPPLALQAVCVRAVAELEAQKKLGRLSAIADRPGLPAALLRTFTELGLAGLDSASVGGELGVAFAHYQALLAELRLADRALMYRAAIDAVRQASAPPVGLPLCLYDLQAKTALEQQLLSALAERSPSTFVTFPCNDGAARSLSALANAAGPALEAPSAPPALRRLQAQLFSSAEESGAADESVTILSAPGESREAVEIVRRVLLEAERGVPFDRMAILLRSPFHYRTHLLEALRRAAVPAHFTREAVRPEPGGRAFLILLECAADGLSATRFAEYLSLGVLPEGPSPAEAAAGPVALADDAARVLRSDVLPTPRRATRRLSVPRRWESLLVDAAVIGGAERWHRRLENLAVEAAKRERPGELAALAELREFALPIVNLLAALPRSAAWGTWLGALRALAERAIDDPAPISSALGELEIVADVGPVSINDVLAVLRERLGEVTQPARTARGGEVLVASVEEARGRVFDVVFVPGLAEKLFPQRVVEDPLLPDRERARLGSALETQNERVASERTALAIAVGAARQRVVLSYPRFESDKARPRVPSFYALEAVRAAEGRLPGFAELARRADEASQTRMGWPAPERAQDAIDASEFDLATLRRFLTGSAKETDGAGHYLLNANPRLRRALQFRARRWRPEWRYVDGLVDPNALGKEALEARHASLLQRGFAVTALEKYSACPYRFYLATVVGLRRRRAAAAVEELDPPTRGLLVHELLRAASSELLVGGYFSPESDLPSAKALVNRVVQEQAARWREDLAPAIPKVWEHAIDELRVDVQTWLHRVRESGWQPLHFEHEFGMRERPPVQLPSGLPLRGAIDAIEQSGSALRATDYKTGTAVLGERVVGGGTFLQPVFYSLVLEQLFPGREILGGNAYYCTTRGEFSRSEVPLSADARAAAVAVQETISDAFAQGFFPAAPAEGACERCDFRSVCGPYEQERVARKDKTRLEPLSKLRGLL